jgi:galactose-1-phosphate uridylyltransferase
VLRADEQATWASVNANHMLPSGSSVFHPHLQGSVNPTPTTFQRLLADTPAERFRDYVDEERRQRRRYLGSTGSIDWLASFAPIGPAELRAFAFGIASPAELTDERVRELAEGIAAALRGAWLERLHWEAAVDLAPEALAERAGSRFGV